jgi:segregation and condensation protein B
MSKEFNFFQQEIETVESTSAPPLAMESKMDGEPKVQEAPTSEAEETPIAIDQHLQQHIKKVIEALLFTSSDPIPLPKIREITDTICPLRPRQLRQMIEELQQEYIATQRAFKLEEIAQGYVLRTHVEYASYLELFYRQRRGEKLSYASTEVLAIIAYRQPITRPQIDAIRGVDSSGTVAQLLERNLIEPVGKLEAPGRPMLYGTTKEFLKHFGLKDLSELKNPST